MTRPRWAAVREWLADVAFWFGTGVRAVAPWVAGFLVVAGLAILVAFAVVGYVAVDRGFDL